jgi:hypothetical protein
MPHLAGAIGTVVVSKLDSVTEDGRGSMKIFKSIFVLAAVLLWAISVACDTPMARPAPVHVCSRNFCVDSTPSIDTVFRCIGQPDSDRCHWSIPGWHRNVLVSDYGVVAVVYDGGKLLPLDYDPETVLIQLWKNGRMVRAIHACEVKGIRHRRIASHYEWGIVRGFDQNERIRVTTSAGKKVEIEDPPEPAYNYFPTTMVDKFRAQWYGGFLNAFEEPSLWELSTQNPTQAYRFTWLRTFHHPVVVRIDVRADGICELTAKVGLGAGGYDPGMLIRNERRPLTRQQSEWFLNEVVRQKFWNLPDEESRPGGMDGSQWIIEGVKNGRYQIQDRWSPRAGPIHDLGLAMIFGLADLSIPKDEIY